MKRQTIILLACASLSVIPAVLGTGCAVTRHEETAGQYTDDSTITAKVKTDLYKDPLVKGSEVNVKTMKGVVQLSGFIDSQEAKDRAGEIARSVKGVVNVHNDLILPTGRTTY